MNALSTPSFASNEKRQQGQAQIFLLRSAIVLLVLLPAAVQGDSLIWNGPGPGLNNWSAGANWTNATAGTFGTAPGAADNVQFLNVGGAASASNINSVVDASFASTIAWLQYGNSSSTIFHTTLISPGQTLNLTGTNGLYVFSPTDPGTAIAVSATITGPGAALNVNNTAANLVINQGQSSGGNPRATLDLSGLDTFTANINRVGLGTSSLPNPSSANQRDQGTFYLARSNTVTLNYADTLANYQTANKANALELSRNQNNNPGVICALYLGNTNALFVDSLGVGRDKASATAAGWLGFNPAFLANNPVAFFRGVAGGNSRVTWWSIGDMNNSSSSSQVSVGTNDFTGGTVDIRADTMSLARDCAPSHTASATIIGVLTFSAGTINVNNLYAGNQSLGPSTSTTPLLGIVNVNGQAALVVNSNLVLGNTVQTSIAAQRTAGILNIRNGTVLANAISVGNANTNSAINLSNATLIVSNTIATPAKALATFNLTNSTLLLNLFSAITNVLVTNLTTSGAITINLSSAATLASYPAQVPLLKYFGALGGAGFAAFTLGSVPANVVGAYLTNNPANKSIDLYLPTDPRPKFTNPPLSAVGNPGDTILLSGTATGVPQIFYQWQLGGTNISDGTNASGSVFIGTATSSLTISNAQDSDTASYTLLATNTYGSASASALVTISSNDIPPTIYGLTNQTVIVGNTAIIVAEPVAKPLPALQWQFNGTNLADGAGPNGETISGSTSSQLTIANVQYPFDQGSYSLIASNAAGVATNSMLLTVLVPPSISSQPQNLSVTNTQFAAFSVTATGVPAPTYQWRKNGAPILNAANASYSITNAHPADMGTYSVLVANSAGSVVSSGATLTVNSVGLLPVSFSPANGAVNVCYDTPLYLTFSQPPVLTNLAAIRIYGVTNGTSPVDTLDLTLAPPGGPQPRLIAGDSFNTYPVSVNGNVAAIYPHLDLLSSNQTYYVTVDNGAFADTNGALFIGISATNTWQFTTKLSGPANPTNVVVAANGSGDFATVQGALDSFPVSNTIPSLVNIGNGTYTEIVNVHSKNNILLRGQSRARTVLVYSNNAAIAPGGSTHSRMAVKVNANDIAFDNLTISNSTAQDASQAEALMIESGAAHTIVNNCNLASYQDTLLANISTSQAYLNQSLIQGDVDFIWGGGNLFFTNCEIRWLTRAANAVALGPNPSPTATDINSNGFSFVNCALTTLPGANPNDVVGRTRGITNGNTALINSFISTNISGWAADALPTSNFRNWYFGCTNDLGASLTLSNAISLAPSDPNLALASSAVSWLNGWTPQLSPNIVTNPASQTITGGATATLRVIATGIPAPAYQWLRNGTNLADGPTGHGSFISGSQTAILTITNSREADTGTYSVIVSNAAGTVTSTAAILTVNNAAPVFTSPISGTVYTINVGVNLSVTNTATDPDGDTLTYGLLQAPGGSNLDPNTGIFTWRPTVSQGNTTNPVIVVVTDSGTGNLSATNAFTINVNPVTPPDITSPSYTGGLFSLTVNGQAGPDYAIQAATNLGAPIVWSTIFRTNSPGAQFQWTDPNTSSFSLRFYRIVVGPPLP